MPHPKTMTMAGDYEYFASQGKHPLVYALAELVDNALRAMRMAGERSDGPHSVTVSILLGSTADSSAICVHDTGVGMTKQELNQWAVMNLSMEDRGQLPTEPAHAGCSQVRALVIFPPRWLVRAEFTAREFSCPSPAQTGPSSEVCPHTAARVAFERGVCETQLR